MRSAVTPGMEDNNESVPTTNQRPTPAKPVWRPCILAMCDGTDEGCHNVMRALFALGVNSTDVAEGGDPYDSYDPSGLRMLAHEIPRAEVDTVVNKALRYFMGCAPGAVAIYLHANPDNDADRWLLPYLEAAEEAT